MARSIVATSAGAPSIQPGRGTPLPSGRSESRAQPVTASVAGSRPTARHASAARATWTAASSGPVSATFALTASAKRAAMPRVRSPFAATQIGGPPGRGPDGTTSAPSIRTNDPS